MAMEPAAISASPAVTTMREDATAPERPAASANGTVSPSAMPITISRTVLLAVKCFSLSIIVAVVLYIQDASSRPCERRDGARVAPLPGRPHGLTADLRSGPG